MSDNETHEQRLVNIELLLMHLQHDVEQLNKAVLDQQAEVEIDPARPRSTRRHG